MEGGRRREHVVAEEVDEKENEVNEEDGEEDEVNEGNENEEEEGENEVDDDRVAINGVNDGVREREMRLNAIGVEAVNAAPRDPIVIDLGNPTDPILVGDLPIHGLEYQEILRTCPPLQEI